MALPLLFSLVLLALQPLATSAAPDPVLYPAPNSIGIRLGMIRADVEATVGAPERVDGRAAQYLSKGFAILYDSSSHVAALLAGQSGAPGALSESFTGSLAGIRMGMTRSEVLEVLGNPWRSESLGSDALLTFRYETTLVTVSLANDAAHHVSLVKARALVQGEPTPHEGPEESAPPARPISTGRWLLGEA